MSNLAKGPSYTHILYLHAPDRPCTHQQLLSMRYTSYALIINALYCLLKVMGSHGLKLHGYLHDVRTRGEEMFIRRRPAHFVDRAR